VPYVICEECGLTTYSAALWSGTEECPRCGTRLPVMRRALIVSLARAAGLMGAAQAHQEERQPAGQREPDDG
jgi:hypothetical protein